MSNLKIDLGCGSCKKEGSIGIDIQAQPGVDFVLDLQVEPLPFADGSVDYVYSSHFLEHITNLANIFSEISRVCSDGANVEFWTPYAWSNSAFIFDHKLFLNEDHYLHMCTWFPEHWAKLLNARWLLKEFTYIIETETLIELYNNNISLDFALKYYKGIVKEFGTFIEVRNGYEGAAFQPIRTFATDRSSQRYPIEPNYKNNINPDAIKNAIEWFASAHLAQLQVPLKETQVELEQVLKSQFQQTQTELEKAQVTIAAMQTSKFWKLRTAWFNFKRGMGIATDE